MHGPLTESHDVAAMLAALDALIPPTQSGGAVLEEWEIEGLLESGAQRPASAASRLRATLPSEDIRACVECGAALDLPAPRVGLPTETWRCLRCGAATVSGTTPPGFSKPGVAQRAHRSERIPVAQLTTSQPAQLRRLVERLTAADYLDAERRATPRYPVSLPAVGIPLGVDGHAAGLPVRVTTRDVSLAGLSGYCETPLAVSLLVIDFTPGGLAGWQAALRVVRQRTTGFLHEFAGEFIGQTDPA